MSCSQRVTSLVIDSVPPESSEKSPSLRYGSFLGLPIYPQSYDSSPLSVKYSSPDTLTSEFSYFGVLRYLLDTQ